MNSWRVATLICLITTGCAQQFDDRLGVQSQGSHEYMFVSGDGHKMWYSALELETLARNYVKQKSIAFDFANTEKAIWVNTGGSRTLATVSFSSGIGKPFLDVTIDRHGKAVRHFIGIAVCGFGAK